GRRAILAVRRDAGGAAVLDGSARPVHHAGGPAGVAGRVQFPETAGQRPQRPVDGDRRAASMPITNSEDCAASMPITNVRVSGSAATCAVNVVASSASWEARTALRPARSYQESATMPCCAGPAPVAKVAMLEAEKLLAK